MAILSPFKSCIFKVTSPYGDRPALGDYHRGIDLVDMASDSLHGCVTAVKPGKVVQSRIVTDKNNKTWEWGNYIAVRQDDGNTAYYCHLHSRVAEKGDTVKTGDVLGIMGNTGYSLGPHLHFEIRNALNNAFDPAAYLGIPNESGAIIEIPTVPEPAYEEIVVTKCGLEKQTRDYINRYKYAADLWRKLAEQMK